MKTPLLTVQELKGRDGVYKFVQKNDGTFIFAETTFENASRLRHKDLALLVDQNRPISAGTIFLFQKPTPEWKLDCDYSETLKLGCDGDHRKSLAALMKANGFSERVDRRY